MTQSLLRFQGVSFAYRPEQPVLVDCDFALEPGERVGLTGPTGSGKTTLLELAIGLLRPAGGEVEVLGRVRRSERDFQEVRGPVGLLFQDADDQLFCPTVVEDVAFGPLNLGKPRPEVRRIVAQTLEALGLGGYEQRITSQLSGGEKRLVALATVLAMEPAILLLDEPTFGLDQRLARRVTEVLLGLPQAMVLVTHDCRFLRDIATRTVRLRQGRLSPGDPD
jgi:cobalt/nickel transport system ATP-binding protein